MDIYATVHDGHSSMFCCVEWAVWLRKFIDKDLGHFPIAVGLLGRRIAQIGDIQEVRQQVRLLACNRFN